MKSSLSRSDSLHLGDKWAYCNVCPSSDATKSLIKGVSIVGVGVGIGIRIGVEQGISVGRNVRSTANHVQAGTRTGTGH